MVNNGQLTRKLKYRIKRKDKIIKDDLDISSLKHMKDEVNELKKGKEGGLSLFNYDAFLEGDIIEAYDILKDTSRD